jgi:hypothetical protein
VDLDDLEEGEGVISRRGSARADLVLSIIKMSMLRLYRARKRPPVQEVDSSGKNVLPSKSLAGPAKPLQPVKLSVKPLDLPTLLGTLVPYLYYQAFLHRLLEVLSEFKRTIDSFGFQMDIKRKDSGEVGGLNWGALVGTAGEMQDGSIDVTLEDR